MILFDKSLPSLQVTAKKDTVVDHISRVTTDS